MLVVTGATTAKVEANNTSIKHIKRKSVNRPRIHQLYELQNLYPVTQHRHNGRVDISRSRSFTTNREGPVFNTDDPTGSFQAAWQAKEQLRDVLNTGSLAQAAR